MCCAWCMLGVSVWTIGWERALTLATVQLTSRAQYWAGPLGPTLHKVQVGQERGGDEGNKEHQTAEGGRQAWSPPSPFGSCSVFAIFPLA